MPPVVDLDDLSSCLEYDKSGMLNHLHAFAEECKRAWEEVSRFGVPESYIGIDKVVILGMGGSAISGEMVQGLAMIESKVPIFVQRDYSLPPFVDSNTLVIASSYSGNTEETLTAFTESLNTPARKIAVTTGGKLGELAAKNNIPVYTIDYQAPPRAALPHSFVPLLGILQKVGLFSDKSKELDEAIQTMNTLSNGICETVPLNSNPAKQLARKLLNRIVVVYGAWVLSAVAQRWKAQLNENSKTMAFHEVFPELNHNAIVGYEYPSAIKDNVFVILLHSSSLNPRIQLRYEATTKLLQQSGISHEIVKSTGKSPLAQMLSTVLFGDYVSFYLSMLNGVDPTPVKVIDFLKKYLSRF